MEGTAERDGGNRQFVHLFRENLRQSDVMGCTVYGEDWNTNLHVVEHKFCSQLAPPLSLGNLLIQLGLFT